MSIPLARSLLAWFDAENRRLPWRGVKDPYRLWVSEVMLQQTTVGAVRRRYRPFLRRFPDVGALAAAGEEEVLAAWSGLGYYARARNLRRAAREIVARHRGRVPSDPAVLRRLPGFGDYMSRAVASLAFGVRLPAADANVDRVLSRVYALRGTAGSARLRRHVLARADALLPADRPGDLTAALMDLGQTICTPRAPDCGRCPIALPCRARRLGTAGSFPRRKPRPRTVPLCLAAAIVERRGRVLLLRRRSTWLDGLWEFPSGLAPSPAAARRALARRLSHLGWRIAATPFAQARHAVVNRRLAIDVFRAEGGGKLFAAAAKPEARWFRPGDLASAAIPTLTRKIAVAGLDQAGDLAVPRTPIGTRIRSPKSRRKCGSSGKGSRRTCGSSAPGPP